MQDGQGSEPDDRDNSMINAFRRHAQRAHQVRQLRRLIADAPTASVRWDLLTIAARSLDYPRIR